VEFTVPSRSMVRTEICVHMPVFGIAERCIAACKTTSNGTHDTTARLTAGFVIPPHARFINMSIRDE
jgi:hypothetical protein